MWRRAQVIPTAAARRRSAAPAPTPISKPREEADEDSEGASALVPEASVDGFGGAIAGVGVVEVGQDVPGSAFKRSTHRDELG